MLPVIPAIIAASAAAALAVQKAQKNLNQQKLIEQSQNLLFWLTQNGFALNPDRSIQPDAKANGTPCLVLAVQLSKLEHTQCLLALGADPNAMDFFGNTALFRVHDIDILKCLIKHGALINPQNIYGKTPLFTNDSIEIVEHLLQNGANPNIQDGHGNTPLHGVQSYEKLELLLNNGADPNVRNIFGKSPLFKTTTLPMACALIRAGARTDIIDNEGNTAPVTTQILEYAPFIELYDNTRNANLYHAVLMNDLSKARDQLEKGANPNTTNHHSSILNQCSTEMLRLLCSFRANPNLADANGNSPLLETIIKNNPDACKILIQYGAELCPVYLEKAIEMHHIECCKCLLEQGLNVDESSWNKAIETYHPDIIELLEKYSDFELSYLDAPTLELKMRAASKHDPILYQENKQQLLQVMYNDPILSNNLYNAVNRCDIEATKYFLEKGAVVTQQIIDIAYSKHLPPLLKLLNP